MIPLRGYIIPIAAALLLISIARGQAADKTTPEYTCADVQAAIKTVMATGSVPRERAIQIIEAMAKGQGATPEQIERARRCVR